jgi:glycosyltransferase involved in cell wall biosynthesis
MIVSKLRADVSARFAGRGDHASEPWPGIRRWKIVHVTSVHSAHDPRILEKECRSLAEQGHEVVLVAPHPRAETIGGVRIRPLPAGRSRGRRFLTAGWRALIEALDEKADVYHLHDPELLLPFQIARALGKRVIFDMHENLPKAVLAKRWISPPLRPLLAAAIRPAERLLLAGLPIVFAEASYVPDYSWAFRTAVVLNFPKLSTARAESAAPPRPRSLCYLGSVRAERGATVTLEAMRLLKETGRSVSWEVIGEAGEGHGRFIRDFADRHGLEVTLHGYVPLDRAWPIASRCELGLALLQPLPNYVDSYPTKIFDYMALGIPVLCSDFPLYRRLVDETGCGRCVDPTRADLVAEAIAGLFDDPEGLKRMSHCGRVAVQGKYNWACQAETLVGFYRGVLSAPTRGR